MGANTKVYSASVEYYTEPDTDSKKTDGMDLIIFADSFAEAEQKIFETMGEKNLREIWGIEVMDAIAVS